MIFRNQLNSELDIEIHVCSYIELTADFYVTFKSFQFSIFIPRQLSITIHRTNKRVKIVSLEECGEI